MNIFRQHIKIPNNNKIKGVLNNTYWRKETWHKTMVISFTLKGVSSYKQ
ncbi:MAG: hypothetical protein ACC707_10080 [Thiohalomonadales bacterium]